MKKILVTGGAGYIGSHTVVELFQAGYQPVIIDNFSNSRESALVGIEAILGTTVPIYRIDCGDVAALRQVFAAEKDIKGVIHFAAFKAVGESVAKPLAYFQSITSENPVLVDIKGLYRGKMKDIQYWSL